MQSSSLGDPLTQLTSGAPSGSVWSGTPQPGTVRAHVAKADSFDGMGRTWVWTLRPELTQLCH